MKVSEIKSTSRSNVSIVRVKLDERIKDSQPQFDDLALRLQSLNNLPSGAGPVIFLKDYGEITTLMLTVASPPASPVEISLRADAVKRAIDNCRLSCEPGARVKRVSIIVCYPTSTPSRVPRRQRDLFAAYVAKKGFLQDVRIINGNGFVGIDAICLHTDAEAKQLIQRWLNDSIKLSQLHPDLWDPVLIHDSSETKTALMAAPGEKYSYRELDNYTDFIKRSLHTLPEVARITRHGVLEEQVNLEFSQERLASVGIQPADLRERLRARNIEDPGGMLEVDGRIVRVRPSGDFKSERDIGSVLIGTSGKGAPVYLRELVDISRNYQSPARYLNFLKWRDAKGVWHRTRAITLSIFMRTEEHIDQFAKTVDVALADLRQRMPEDLVVLRTSDQPKQVEDNVDLFMNSYEAIVLVVLTALIGFWEWRSAVLIALSIPATLAMTFGMMFMLGIDLQQCSIASLIIALGLLVDDPVVSGDAIKRCLGEEHHRLIASWLGPTRLAHAIMYATFTNIAAYLPLLMITGTIGQFLVSMAIVITCSLIASRVASMTFVPLPGYYLLRPPGPSKNSRLSNLKHRIIDGYMSIGHKVLDRRVMVFCVAVGLLICGFAALSKIKTAFFPDDEFNVCWVDVWLPEAGTLAATNAAAVHVERVIQDVARQYGEEIRDDHGKPRDVLQLLTIFTGGSGPRFWNSILPELDQMNYAQVLIQLSDKHDTAPFIPKLQRALSAQISEARCDVRILEGGKPVGIPVAVRLSGSSGTTLRTLAAQVSQIMRNCPTTERIRDDWGVPSFSVNLRVDNDKANLAGLSNMDIADSSLTGLNGYQVDVLREGDKQIPIVARLRSEESAQIQGISDLYVYSVNNQRKVPLPTVASVNYTMEQERIIRRNQFETITVSCFPIEGVLPSEVMESIHPQLDKFRDSLPPGYKLEIGGMEEEQLKSFDEMAVVMAVSIMSIFLCMVIQFKNAIKPMLVFVGLPFGLLGALVGLSVMQPPFGFSAFMGVASLAGVIVSHVIVLFDFIEEGRESGMPLRDALLQASMIRLRPVLVTVGATVLGFIPLAMHGGPLWQPLCYAQIGGLIFATFVTLGLVPIVYAITVLDLKLIKWSDSSKHIEPASIIAD